MSCPTKYIPAEYNEDVYQAFLEGNPVKMVLAECKLKKATGLLWDDLGFTINTPLFGYAGAYKGVDFRAIVLVCARSRHAAFKPENPNVRNQDITDNEKELINAIMNIFYG
jgi:hypothetical protein